MTSKADIVRRLQAERDAAQRKIDALNKVPDVDNMVVGTMVRVTVTERRSPHRTITHLLHKIAGKDGPEWTFTGTLSGMKPGYDGLTTSGGLITWDGLVLWAAEHVEIESWEMLAAVGSAAVRIISDPYVRDEPNGEPPY